jgi:GTP-dependent phosphoenolpyruvate carboxykinase
MTYLDRVPRIQSNVGHAFIKLPIALFPLKTKVMPVMVRSGFSVNAILEADCFAIRLAANMVRVKWEIR